MNNYTKLLTDLTNMDEVIKDEDKTLIPLSSLLDALILLSSLPDGEYEIVVLTLINGKASLSYNDVLVAFVNREVRRKDKESSSSNTTVEAMQEEWVSVIGRAREMSVSPRLVIANWEKINVLSARKKNIGRLSA